RHVNGQVIMYADHVTRSMKQAIDEVNRRRVAQIRYNEDHDITPQTIQKPIREKLVKFSQEELDERKERRKHPITKDVNPDSLTPKEKKKLMLLLRTQMREAAKDLDFEEAARLRDRINSMNVG
ncbi:UvrB/UvrC motif-containing protein, partial [Candidatus Roizmanbacteria bacterium]|nr:UvrB/UvrC motif-containing protein [Candidatus Roizmanbacteria bacterium]